MAIPTDTEPGLPTYPAQQGRQWGATLPREAGKNEVGLKASKRGRNKIVLAHELRILC